jgi:hypothetical protein
MRRCVTFLLVAMLAMPARASAQVSVRYSQAADVFELLDNVSNWWPGYSNAEYRQFWMKQLPLTADDERLLVQYARIRERYFDKTGQSNEDPATSEGGVFTARATLAADPLGDAFLGSQTIDEALRRLEGIAERGEIDFLRQLYAKFESRYLPLVTAHEQASQASITETMRTLSSPAFGEWIARLERYFNVPRQERAYEALYVWWPDSMRVTATPHGRYLELRALVKPGEKLNAGAVISHEVVHVLSALQPSPQKRSLTDSFLRECPAPAVVGRLETIEEPMAVVLGNMLFTKRFRPERYRYAKRWHGQERVDVYAKLLLSPVGDAFEGGRTITEGFAEQAVPLCKSLLALRRQ